MRSSVSKYMSKDCLNQVAEIQGLYGPVSISEKVVQRIWSQQEILERTMRTRCGMRLLIKHPGRWNRSEEGPDFKDAVMEIDGRQVIGDVEIHIYGKDWREHGHADDPNFSRVRLHVVLFDSIDLGTNDIPTVVLGPYLRDDIEGYLLTRHESGEIAYLFEAWSSLPAAEIRKELIENAATRWKQKCVFARNRIGSEGFDAAMHGLTLEILGYRRNRTAMADASKIFPMELWQKEPPSAHAVMTRVARPWVKSGMRPANLPEKRLEQYRQLWLKNPQWIAQLRQVAWPTLDFASVASVGTLRKQIQASRLRHEVLGIIRDTITGTRLDTLIIDGWLPLLAADCGLDLKGLWSAWYSGDFPENLSKELGFHAVTDGRLHPHANVWNQGLLQAIFTR